jgi:hypothetical protein
VELSLGPGDGKRIALYTEASFAISIVRIESGIDRLRAIAKTYLIHHYNYIGLGKEDRSENLVGVVVIQNVGAARITGPPNLFTVVLVLQDIRIGLAVVGAFYAVDVGVSFSIKQNGIMRTGAPHFPAFVTTVVGGSNMIIEQAFTMVLPHNVVTVGMFMIGRSTTLECDYGVVGFPAGTTDNPVKVVEMI